MQSVLIGFEYPVMDTLLFYFLKDNVLTNEHFIATCQKSSIATASHPFGNALNAAVAEFSLSKRNEIPNLLSEEFRLS